MNIIKYATNRKYRIFSKKIKDVNVSIWEFEFKIAKSRQVREGVRQDRDNAIESVLQIDTRLKVTTDEAEIEKMNKDKAIYTDNIQRYEAQMKMIDEQIRGVLAKDEDPGQQGILDTIKSLIELKQMYQSYLKEI